MPFRLRRVMIIRPKAVPMRIQSLARLCTLPIGIRLTCGILERHNAYTPISYLFYNIMSVYTHTRAHSNALPVQCTATHGAGTCVYKCVCVCVRV